MGLFDFLFGGNKKSDNNVTSGSYTIPDYEFDDDTRMSVDELKAFFAEIFATQFPEFDVKQDVSATELADITGVITDIHPACTPVDFLISKDGQPFIAMVLVSARTYRGMNVLGTKAICDMAQLQYVRFYTDMPNKKDYVVNRLRSFLY